MDGLINNDNVGRVSSDSLPDLLAILENCEVKVVLCQAVLNGLMLFRVGTTQDDLASHGHSQIPTTVRSRGSTLSTIDHCKDRTLS